jgi:two-component system chemotaxis response regulator CheB
MDERPTPVIICSSLTEKGARITLDAMSAGAVAVITKPTINLKSFLQEAAKDLIQEVRNAARARMGVVKRMARPAERGPGGEIAPKLTADVVLEAPSGLEKYRTTEKIIAIGTSTGGTQRWNTCCRGCRRPVRAWRWCSTCRKNSPPRLPTGSTACAKSKSGKRKTATV